jgi:Flp pilus assembly protein TadG
MTSSFVLKRHRDAQTLVFFLLAFGTIFLLCGLAIDSGLLYLAKARMSRAVDGAALAAVGNFNVIPNDAQANRAQVAEIMRNFAIANFTDLGTTVSGHSIPNTTTEVQGSVVSNGVTTTTYTYNFNDNTFDPNGQPRRYVEVVLTAGSGGQIITATCNARCPVQTYFIGYADGIIGGFKGISSLKDLKVSSSAEATRNPRLIMVVVDRSASMLQTGGGAFGLPQAVVTFLDFFDTSSDYIGIVSFGSNARLEMPLTTNFLNAGTNNLIDSYTLASNFGVGSAEYGETVGVPGIDPEMDSANADYDPTYSTNGVRRLKFGGDTAADEGIRLALECLESNSGFNNPDVVKYIVLFTDGAWNTTRTLLAAPTYTNIMVNSNPTASGTNIITSNTAPSMSGNLTNGGANGVTYMPALSPMPQMTNALNDLVLSSTNVNHHSGDYWLSFDTNSNLEPLPTTPANAQSNPGGMAGAPATINSTMYLGAYSGKNVYTTSVNVWMQPGSVDYLYHNGSVSNIYIGDSNNPMNTINLTIKSGDSNMLVVPGYIVDGTILDTLDLTYEFAPDYSKGYRWDNYNTAFMWPDDQTAAPTASNGGNDPFWYTPAVVRNSFMRSLLFRNYANMLTGFYVFRADDPLGSATEPLTGALRPLNGLGAYYPSAPFYFPFDLVGVDWDSTFALTNALNDPDTTDTGMSRNLAWSINMLSTNAAPNWSGELFYKGTGAALSGTTAASTVMSSASDWQIGAPDWLTSFSANNMYTDPTSNTVITPNPKVWRPNTFRGTLIGNTNGHTVMSLIQSNPSTTGGYMVDSSNGDVYSNTMSWNGRPTHYYDFSNSTWVAVKSNHNKNVQAYPLGVWKAEEYAWHARASGVTIYTVGYGTLVSDSEQLLLAQIANATNTTGYSSTNSGNNVPISYNPAQPIGAQYYADTTNAISNDFYAIGQAINAALTQ